MNTDLMFSSKNSCWTTPQNFYDKLNKEFEFTLDPCADDYNHKCDKYFTEADDGLSQSWAGNKVFCNPPYGKEIKKWVKKAWEEAKQENTIIILLIPARTDTSYFHDYIYGEHEIRFIRGRLKFGEGKNSAPFPSMIVIMQKYKGR